MGCNSDFATAGEYSAGLPSAYGVVTFIFRDAVATEGATGSPDGWTGIDGAGLIVYAVWSILSFAASAADVVYILCIAGVSAYGSVIHDLESWAVGATSNCAGLFCYVVEVIMVAEWIGTLASGVSFCIDGSEVFLWYSGSAFVVECLDVVVLSDVSVDYAVVGALSDDSSVAVVMVLEPDA